ncbi:MAG: secreted serine protease [Pseudobdellovibrio sp.]|nr:secreted serine protease [Pseudobdellovibrio sp.]
MKLFLHVICRFIVAAVFLTAFSSCNNSSVSDNESQYIGNYRSPFAENKVQLDTPKTKTVEVSPNKMQKVAFDPEADAIPGSVIIRMSCAREFCQENTGGGRLTCDGLKKAIADKWPESINRYSFTYKFEPGETTEEIQRKFEGDSIDRECVVGLSNYAEFKVFAATNDPDVLQTNAAYTASPYLNQIGYFEANNAIGTVIQSLPAALAASTLSPKPAFRIGIIDGNFFAANPDVPKTAYFTGVQTVGNYNLENDVIINIGGAPLPATMPTDGISGHAMFVTQLIMGQSNNSYGGSGVFAYASLAPVSGTIVAANVYSVNENGEKTISIDDVNNALALMAALKVDVINMSLGSRAFSPPATMLAAILNAIGQGSTVVVAAGNDGFNISQKLNRDGTPSTSQVYPAAWGAEYYGLITVAAMNKAGSDLALFSNFGNSTVEIAAPGEALNVLGARISGTSFASPLVAGAAAYVAAFYKSKKIEVTPAQIELALLKGSVNVPALDSRIKGGLSLNLPALNTQLTTGSISQLPSAKLDNDGFWYTRDGTSMNYEIRTVTSNVDESDTSLYVGIWEKLDETLPPLAYVQARNGQDNFKLPFYQFVVGDEGVWIVLYKVLADGKRKFISSKLYKFVDLIKTPTLSETVVLGAINQVNTAVEGWACLNGRPDHVVIEARVGSPTGPVALKVPTSVQPKGRDYFDACTPFIVTMGFEIPLGNLKVDTAYHFVAVHPADSAKNKLLNAEAFIIEGQQKKPPVLSNIKKSIIQDTITVKGSVCWEGQIEAGSLSSYIFNPTIYDSETLYQWVVGIMKREPVISTMIDNNKALFKWRDNYEDYPRVSITGTRAEFENYSNSTSWLSFQQAMVPAYRVDAFGSAGIMEVAALWDNGVPRKWFTDKNQPALERAPIYAYENPLLSAGDMTTQIVRNDVVCTGQGKSGIGQDFTVVTSRSKLLNKFNISSELILSIIGEPPSPYTKESIQTAFSNLNTIYKTELMTNGRNFINNLISNGDFIMSVRLLSHSSGSTTQEFNLKAAPALP